MSTTDHDLVGNTNTPAFFPTSESLHYAITHVFLPVELPDRDDYSHEKELPLLGAVCIAAHAYGAHANGNSDPQWGRITRMLDKLQASLQPEGLSSGHIIAELRGMQTTDTLTFFIQRQNAAVLLTKSESSTLFELFEVSPRGDAIQMTAGSLICSYPGSAIEVPNEVFDDRDFQTEFAEFLSLPNAVDRGLPSPPASQPQYITALLSGILRAVGRTSDVLSITKRIRDHVGRPRENNGRLAECEKVWRRSPLWLLIRVAMELCIDRAPLGHMSYKKFLLFFICMFATSAKGEDLSNDILHLMASKILRRLGKLDSGSSGWLSEMALETCECLREILDARWIRLQSNHPPPPPFRNPSQDELARDTQFSLLGSRKYIDNALANCHYMPPSTSFHTNHLRRGTLHDFLSSHSTNFLEDAYAADPDTTLRDIEKSVAQDIDEWFAHVTNIDEACAQLEMLMDKYMLKALIRWGGGPESSSIMVLTALELFVALDKLVVAEIPMLADYSPEIPTTFLETLLLRKASSFHRLSRVYQYLSMRHSQSHPGWSILSNEFTEDSFPVRYYDQSPHLRQLEASIKQHAMESLPTLSLHAKVVTFELQCPTYIRIWRSAAPRILHHFGSSDYVDRRDTTLEEHNLLARFPGLEPYFVRHEHTPLAVQIHFACYSPEASEPRSSLRLRYAIQYSHFKDQFSASGDYEVAVVPEKHFSIWRQDYSCPGFRLTYRLSEETDCSSCKGLAEYVNDTSHTSNSILAAQADCPPDLSLEEFIAFAHLRSGGLLQWINILQGLRGRTLSIRRHHVHYLLSQAVFQVGPLDVNTGAWIWHQELQDISFCTALLGELDSLFVEVGAGAIDGIMMNTISLLLTRILESSPSEGILKRAIALLRRVRRKTFDWVQELSYNLAKAPMNKERSNLLLDMALTCRATFDVDSATLRTLFQSPEDVDAALSCALFVPILQPARLYIRDHYSLLLFQRDRRLSFALEDVLGDVILADASDYGIDLAVRKIFASHVPSSQRWEHLQHPDSRWFTCRSAATSNHRSQTVQFDILDGTLRVGNQPIGGLPQKIRSDPVCQQIFRDQGFFVIPSNLPGMDFTTLTATLERKVHFTLQGDNLVVRAKSWQSNDILELIPASKLADDLPLSLIVDHVHWLSLSSQVIEIRPLDRLWEQSSANWRIDCGSRPCRVYKGHEMLVDIRSPTWEMASKCFECLHFEAVIRGYQNRSLLITATPMDPLRSEPILGLSVTLPRSGLSFFANNQGELESRDFKYMVYDETRSIGALFGVENLLVLRQKSHLTDEIIPRRVLIPNDRFVKHGDYQVQVDTKYYPLYNGSGEPLYHIYDVDTELGCLVGNGMLTSTQHLARLHAMTSFDKPDPLTGKTGAQAALDLFQSAGCQSVMKYRTSESNSWGWETHYPQINVLYQRIRHSFFSPSNLYDSLFVGTADQHAMQRAAYLFSSNVTRIAPAQGSEDANYSMQESDSELEDIAFTTAFVIQRWSISTDAISDWVDLWTCGDDVHMDAASSHLSGIWAERLANFNLVQTLCDAPGRREDARQRFQLLFLLPTTAYCSSFHQAAFLSMLIAFAKRLDSQCLANAPIHYTGCKISDGYRPTKEVIWHRFREARIQREPEMRFLYSEMEEYSVDSNAKNWLKDWPSDALPTLSSLWGDSDLWDVASLTSDVQQLFSSCYRNFKLKEYLIRVVAEAGSFNPSRPTSSLRQMSNQRIPSQITLDQLLANRPAPELPTRGNLFCDSQKLSADSTFPLSQLLSSISKKKSSSLLQQQYVALLEKSAQYVREEYSVTHSLPEEDHINALEKHYVRCRVTYLDALRTLKKALRPTTERQKALSRFGQWPPITGDVLLRCLASTSPISLPEHWKKCIISLSLLLLDLQRARRLLRFALDGREEELSKELENEGCDGWDPAEYPDWLLIQIQGNFLIRRTQAEIAMEIMSPKSGENTVMQVKMGEGKSSVIIPIAAAALANSKQLVRVIVPKTLMVQMFDLLVSRLGGLASRQIYCLPFSRPIESTDNQTGFATEVKFSIHDIQNITRHCMEKCGVLLVQPEHIASLKLMSIEEHICKDKYPARAIPNLYKLAYKHIATVISLNLLPRDSLVREWFQWLSKSSNRFGKDTTQADPQDEHGDVDLGNVSEWLTLQKWFHSHCRDILDESDEVLHPRFRLIYTIGLPQHIDGYSYRWTITQQVLRLVKKHVLSLSKYAPDLVECECGPLGSFPHIHILQPSDVGRHLVSLVVEDVFTGHLPILNLKGVSPKLEDAIRSFIADEDVLQVPDTVKMVEEYANMCSQQLWSALLLLRGLLSSNVLLFALAERRWRVDYGLVSPPKYADRSSTPTMLAVPYRGKDLPAPNTHFGHPDITIILTCLSYYYDGLDEEQLRISFERLLDEDDPSTEYALWVKEYDSRSLPEPLRMLNEMNLRSSEQWDKAVFPLFARNQCVIDFYLSRVVFPHAMKEYPRKLCVSNWDLVEKREQLITGFSGTNDGRWLLPMSIAQRDLDHQQGTNAEVLACLLQPENDFYAVAHESGKPRSTDRFLQIVAAQEPEICILLDVGAQILDFSNQQVARAWLRIARHIAGAIYFNKDDELMVLMRNGFTIPLSSSSLSQQLDRCVVYLDHAHTRGTDIKLPIGSRAAVTLGPKVTKDRLVQGCMRMRKLGRGHSVMFFAPPEVDRSIRAVVAKEDPSIRVATVDVLTWAINETWIDIQQRAPYWAQQGMNYKSRSRAWADFANGMLTREKLADAWLQPDIKSLADLYAPSEAKSSSHSLSQLDPEIRQRLKNLGVLSLPNAEMAEEQEREVNREREREREVELPPKAESVKHSLHPDVVEFVKTGNIPPSNMSSAFRPVFTTLEKSSAANLEANVWSPSILATTDFCQTIKPESTHGTIDQYLRPIQWILTRKKYPHPLLVLLSPYEVDRLIPDIRASEYVHLHVYAPRTSQRMKPSDDLGLYTIPPLPSDWNPPWTLIDQLNIFAGQLYLRDYDSYLRLCGFLGLPAHESPNNADVQWNMFNVPGSIEENEIRFSGSPLPSVMALLSIRRRGLPFGHTHMGQILQGHPLTVKDFRESESRSAASGHTARHEEPTPQTDTIGAAMDVTVEFDAPDAPESPMLLQSPKRWLGADEIADANSDLPKKRAYVDK